MLYRVEEYHIRNPMFWRRYGHRRFISGYAANPVRSSQQDLQNLEVRRCELRRRLEELEAQIEGTKSSLQTEEVTLALTLQKLNANAPDIVEIATNPIAESVFALEAESAMIWLSLSFFNSI